MGKKIWIIHHYADPPDGYWTGTYDLYKFLVQKGHQVTVFSSSFNHYSREDSRLKPDELYAEKDYNGMHFVFIKTPPYFKNNLKRLWNMLLYGLRSYWWGARQKQGPDVIITATPHPFCAFAAYRLARKFKVPFLLELHDLWLDYLLDTHMVSRWHPAYQVIRWLETSCYKNAKKILILWPKMDLYLKNYGVPPERIVWLPLGIDFETLEKISAKSNKEDGNFVVACTARFGPASNLLEILQAAKILQDQGHHRIKFVLIGDGPEREKLEEFVQENHLTHVEFPGMIPKEQIRKNLVDADACIAGLPDIPNYRKYGTIPTKLLDYLTSGRPTIFITSIQESLVDKAQAGAVVHPNQPGVLAESILKLSRLSSEERARLGENGMEYMRIHHNLKTLADRVEALL